MFPTWLEASLLQRTLVVTIAPIISVWFFLLPGAIATILLVRKNATLKAQTAFYLPLTFVLSCAISYTLFWVFFFDIAVGRIVGQIYLCVPTFFLVISKTLRQDLKFLFQNKNFKFPLILMILLTTFQLNMLNSVSRGEELTPISQNKIGHQMPPDCYLPKWFSDMWFVYNYKDQQRGKSGNVGHRSGDRPPLQAAIFLSLRQLNYPISTSANEYQFIATFLQSSWILAFWFLFQLIRARSSMVIYTLLLATFSSLTFFNGIFVWPKLLSACLWILGFCFWFLADTSIIISIFTGLTFALNLLSHGSTAFALIPVAILSVIRFKKKPFLHLVIAGITFFASYLPWILYQKLYDPPSDQVAKLHLTDVDYFIQPNADLTTPIFKAMIESLKKLTFEQWLQNRFKNLTRPFTNYNPFAVFTQTVSQVRVDDFFYLANNFIFLFPLLLLILVRWPIKDKQLATKLRLIFYNVLIGLFSWAMLMLAPDTTVIHQGPYGLFLMLFVLIGALLSCLPIWVGTISIIFAFFKFASLWIIGLQPSSFTKHPSMFVGIVALLIFTTITLKLANQTTFGD